MEGVKMKKEQLHDRTTLLAPSKDNKKQPYRKSDAVKLLERLIFDSKRNRYPNIPVKYLNPVKFRDDTSNGLSNCIISFLKMCGHHAERTENEGRVINNRKLVTYTIGRTRIIGSTKRIYTSDLKAVIKGRFVAIEIKCSATHDQQSQAQKDYEKLVVASGGMFFTASTFEGFFSWYNTTFMMP
jgi:hypothetical protein